jgi:hypothetical protein
MNNAKVSTAMPTSRSPRQTSILLIELFCDGCLPPLVRVRREEGGDSGLGDQRHRLLPPCRIRRWSLHHTGIEIDGELSLLLALAMRASHSGVVARIE